MENTTKHFSVSMSSIYLESKNNLPPKSYPVMSVLIQGTPGLSDIINLMNEIKTLTKEVKEDYISVTDLSKLTINKFFGKIILSGMEATYKSLISVGRQSIISFVVIGETQEYKDMLTSTLQSINEQKLNPEKDYNYRYYFVKSKEEVKSLAEQLLA